MFSMARACSNAFHAFFRASGQLAHKSKIIFVIYVAAPNRETQVITNLQTDIPAFIGHDQPFVARREMLVLFRHTEQMTLIVIILLSFRSDEKSPVVELSVIFRDKLPATASLYFLAHSFIVGTVWPSIVFGLFLHVHGKSRGKRLRQYG